MEPQPSIGKNYMTIEPNPRDTYEDQADGNSPMVRILQDRVRLETTPHRPTTNSKFNFQPCPPKEGNKLLASIALLDDIDMVSNMDIQERIPNKEYIEVTPAHDRLLPRLSIKQLHFKAHIIMNK